MAKETKKRGACRSCGKACFIECAACFAVLLVAGQEHGCSEECTETIQLCDACEEEGEKEDQELTA